MSSISHDDSASSKLNVYLTVSGNIFFYRKGDHYRPALSHCLSHYFVFQGYAFNQVEIAPLLIWKYVPQHSVVNNGEQ